MVSYGSNNPVRIGIIGGSGLCTLPDLLIKERVRPATPYGEPSDDILVGRLGDTDVAFLPRHGEKHHLAPHRVPYRANLAALKSLGVRFVLATCIAGSLKKAIAPGDMVVPDQFVNLTWGRDDLSEAGGGSFIHLPMADPYCDVLRSQLISAAPREDCSVHESGTVTVIQGPRFSTRAESQLFIRNGWDIVNMTQYPECYFARELGLCYGCIAAITDYDVGVPSSLSMDPEHLRDVLKIFTQGVVRLNSTLKRAVAAMAGRVECSCATTLVRPYYESVR